MKVTIYFGSETGNTEMLADDLAKLLGSSSEVEVHDMATADPTQDEPGRLWLILSSTYGDGELPSSAQPFAAKLEAARPDLSGRRYAVFGLGSSEYPTTFGAGSGRMDALLASLGAKRVGERHVHDALGPDLAEDAAADWLAGIIRMVEQDERM